MSVGFVKYHTCFKILHIGQLSNRTLSNIQITTEELPLSFYSHILEGIGADDPTKYINMYNYLLKLCINRENLQIIIVDNDIPQGTTTSLKPFVVKQFNIDGHDNLPRGFTDDIYNL